MFTIDVTDNQTTLTFDADRLRQAAEAILRDAGLVRGTLSIAVVDDPTIHELNNEFLQHDYPTDVLSFLLEQETGEIEGEVIVSTDTAVRLAKQLGWPAENELLLYVVHGTLHLVGYEDSSDEERAAMHAAEDKVLAQFSLQAPRQTLDGSKSNSIAVDLESGERAS